jgi:hypothetical protein
MKELLKDLSGLIRELYTRADRWVQANNPAEYVIDRFILPLGAGGYVGIIALWFWGVTIASILATVTAAWLYWRITR